MCPECSAGYTMVRMRITVYTDLRSNLYDTRYPSLVRLADFSRPTRTEPQAVPLLRFCVSTYQYGTADCASHLYGQNPKERESFRYALRPLVSRRCLLLSPAFHGGLLLCPCISSAF